MWQYSIQRHQDNDYDLIITILPENVEFGSDLFSAERKESVQRSLQSVLSQTKKFQIKTVKIILSGILIASIPYSVFAANLEEMRSELTDTIRLESLLSASNSVQAELPFHMTYLYGAVSRNKLIWSKRSDPFKPLLQPISILTQTGNWHSAQSAQN